MSDTKVAALITSHVNRYSTIEIIDIYKLLHQAVFGPGHALKNAKAAREWLDRESETLQPVSHTEPLVENIHPDGQIVRVYLRPYIAIQGNSKKLLDSFVASSKAVEGDLALIAQWWGIFQGMLTPGGSLASRFDARVASLVGRTRAGENWPAGHHSPPYDRTYHPAYRVLTRAQAEELFTKQKLPFTIV